MAIDTNTKVGRRHIANEFKSPTVARGTFAIRCSASGEVWVGSSPNLGAVQNSLWFQLGTGRYRNSQLQRAWQEHGEAALNLEMLEQFDDDVSPLLLNDPVLDRKKDVGGKALGAGPLTLRSSNGFGRMGPTASVP